jgi:hypothetical protein
MILLPELPQLPLNIQLNQSQLKKTKPRLQQTILQRTAMLDLMLLKLLSIKPHQHLLIQVPKMLLKARVD